MTIMSLERAWKSLIDCCLPVRGEGSIWRYNREARPDDPPHGWKIHLSGTILNATAVLEAVWPYLSGLGVQFKAPCSISEFEKLNSGLHYGYSQVGKFITVYTVSADQAVIVASRLHELTKPFDSVQVPFDNRFAPGSSVFYRYGAFRDSRLIAKDGRSLAAVKDPDGALVCDDRFEPVPTWVTDPFVPKQRAEPAESPLPERYRVFKALRQRGKGGTYLAVDTGQSTPSLCVIKEGRRFGELTVTGQDGFELIANEAKVLQQLHSLATGSPAVRSVFLAGGNIYMVLEYINGRSLFQSMRLRERRFSIAQVSQIAVQIANVIAGLHEAGWVWNDCKPANLMQTVEGRLRPIDFETAYPIGSKPNFDWQTSAYARPSTSAAAPGETDLFALAAVIFFLLTGTFFNPGKPEPVARLRRGVPRDLALYVEHLLKDTQSNKSISAAEVAFNFAALDASIVPAS